jgi:hypothetical protein
MTYNTRFILLLLTNSLAIFCMLKYLLASGIDVQNTTILDNADNLPFMFDFMAYASMVFVANFYILSYPSLKHCVLKRLMHRLETASAVSRARRPKKKANNKIKPA